MHFSSTVSSIQRIQSGFSLINVLLSSVLGPGGGLYKQYKAEEEKAQEYIIKEKGSDKGEDQRTEQRLRELM